MKVKAVLFFCVRVGEQKTLLRPYWLIQVLLTVLVIVSELYVQLVYLYEE